MLIGLVATRIHAPLTWWRRHLPAGFRRFLAKLWPLSYAACVLSWFALLPGVPLLEYYFGVDNPLLILAILFFALITLLLTIIASFAYDLQVQGSAKSSAPEPVPHTAPLA
jgi:hypothetical protein